MWIEEVKERFDGFASGEILYYIHWDTGEEWADIPKESVNLQKLIGDTKDYVVFAKSIGSIIALKNIYEKTISPKKLIICGLPYLTAKASGYEIDKYLEELHVETIFIQNEFDPLAGYEDVRKIVEEKVKVDCKVINEVGIDSHSYRNWELLIETAEKFFKTEITKTN